MDGLEDHFPKFQVRKNQLPMLSFWGVYLYVPFTPNSLFGKKPCELHLHSANDSSLDASYVTMISFTGMHGHKDPVPILWDFLLEDVYQPFKSHPTKTHTIQQRSPWVMPSHCFQESLIVLFRLASLVSSSSTLPKFNSWPLKSYLPSRKVVSQPPFFRGELLNFRGVKDCDDLLLLLFLTFIAGQKGIMSQVLNFWTTSPLICTAWFFFELPSEGFWQGVYSDTACTVDGLENRHPPVDMVNIPFFSRFRTSQVVGLGMPWDFFHQQ